MKRKYLWLLIMSACILISGASFAQNSPTPNNFFIIPEQSSGWQVLDSVRQVGASWWNVWDNYNREADRLNGNLGDQFASGIMTRDTLIQYIIYLVRFVSQIALVIGAVMIIYAWYVYAISIFSGGDAAKGNTAIKYAIYGIIVVASSYAIMRILISAFLT